MEIEKGIMIVDLGLLLDSTLILGDFHIGYEEELNKQGVLVPRFQHTDTIKRLERIFDYLKKNKIELNKIIINGDLKHEFSIISRQEWRETLRLIELLKARCEELILIKGNHDTILGPIAMKRDIRIVDFVQINDTIITHGHKILEELSLDKKEIKKIRTIIIGHEHPAIALKEGVRTEKYKCFLRGKCDGKALIVHPSFITVTEGTDIAKEELLSPYLQQDLSDFDIWVVADKVYYFGKAKNI